MFRRTLPKDAVLWWRGDPAETIGTPRQMVNAIVHWARSGEEDLTTTPWPALYQWLANYTCSDDQIDLIGCF